MHYAVKQRMYYGGIRMYSTYCGEGLCLISHFQALLDETYTEEPSPQCEIFFGLIGGEASRVPSDATAYAHRDTLFAMNIHGRWEQANEDAQGIAWTRHAFEAMTPYATGGVYVNFMTQEETDRVSAAYGPSYERLQTLKRRYDPTNLFRLNQNIAPA